MHLLIILTALGFAWVLRFAAPTAATWKQRWSRALFFFLFSPLLLLMTALAVLWMGPSGEMLGLQASWFSYILSLGFIAVAAVSLLKLAYQGSKAGQQIRTYCRETILGQSARILDTPFPYSAQIGFWQPELVVSRGLLDNLDCDHLEAVLAHERAHCYYRDTFCFFWLGWLRSFTSWLPNTEILWQELLLLRELRADRFAARQVDPLLLAESLLAVAKAPLMRTESFCAPLSCAIPRNRLAERIDALLAEPESAPPASSWWTWTGILLAFLPLFTLPFHS